MATNIPYSQYASPPSHLSYSADFFDTLTISQVLNISYPRVSPPGSVLKTEFRRDIPLSASSTVIVPGEVIPSYTDLLPITSTIEDAYKAGFRSAYVEFVCDRVEYGYTYHFSKLNLIRNCTNYSSAVESYRHLLSHIQSYYFDLGPALKTFQDSPFTAKVKGFYVTSFPLYKLGCLLQENWLEEDVFNAILELSYMSRAKRIRAGLPDSSEISDALLLPTSFLRDGNLAYHSTPQEYTPEIYSIRNRIMATPVRTVAMSLVNENHYTSFVYDIGSPAVKYGDSLHHLPPSELLPVLQWIFQGISHTSIDRFEVGIIGLQGPTSGEGSCGIAASNFIQLGCHTTTNLLQWEGDMSALFRDAALEGLIKFHHLASQTESEFTTWVEEICKTPHQSHDHQVKLSSSFGFGYQDFNLFLPKITHPIHIFNELPDTYLSRQITRPSYSRVPLISNLPTSSIDHTTLLSPIQLTHKSITAPLPKMKLPVSFSPPPPTKRRRRHSAVEPIMVVSSPDSPEFPSPEPSQKALDDTVIDLCSPEQKKQISALMIETNKKVHLPKPTTIKAEEKEVIDLCTPTKPRKHESAKIKAEGPGKDFTTPPRKDHRSIIKAEGNKFRVRTK